MKKFSFILGFVIPFCIIAGFSVYLNPYEVFRDTHLYGVRESGSRLRTAYSILYRKPKGLILGTSTASSLSPRHPGWSQEAQPVIYANNNYAMFYENLRNFQHAEAIQPIKQVVFDLFFDNCINTNTYSRDFTDKRLAARVSNEKIPAINYAVNLMPDIHEALFSTAAISYTGDFLSTKLKIKRHIPSEPIPEEQILAKYQQTFQPNYPICNQFFQNREKIIHRMKLLLDTARENETELKMFTSIFHARRMKNIQKTTCWEPYKEWLKDMVELVAEDNAANPDKVQFEIWGFSQYNEITMEEITDLDENYKSKMKWFRDGLHSRDELGNLVLDRIFDYHDPNRTLPDNFGLLLSPENLDSYINELENGLEQYIIQAF